MNKPVTYWQRLKARPLLWNLVLIAVILLAMAVMAHLFMLAVTRHGSCRTVPDLTGIALHDAERIARQNKLQLVVNDSLYVPTYDGGIVLDQLPEKGVEVKPGRTVYITINSFSQKMVPVPYVAGRSLRQAKNMLETASLEIEKLVYRPDMATNYVLEQLCNGKTVLPTSQLKAEAGSGVTLIVGVQGGYGTAVVPRIVGATLREAKGRLWENGLNVGRIHFDEGINLLNEKEARVYEQGPSQGRSATLGTPVDLKLTLDRELVGRNSAAAEKLARELAEERLLRESAAADSLARLRLLEALQEGTGKSDSTQNISDAPDEFFH